MAGLYARHMEQARRTDAPAGHRDRRLS
jgi:hypothetical protein